MKIYYAIMQEIELEDKISDLEIEETIAKIANGCDYVWSTENDLFGE